MNLGVAFGQWALFSRWPACRSGEMALADTAGCLAGFVGCGHLACSLASGAPSIEALPRIPREPDHRAITAHEFALFHGDTEKFGLRRSALMLPKQARPVTTESGFPAR